MVKRVTLLALVSLMVLAAACGDGSQPTQTSQAPSPPPKPKEEPVTIYEITKDDITTHPDWTSRNISVLGVKLGDTTRNVEKNLGELENTRTGQEDYITAYQKGGIVVHTFKLTGKARRIEVTGLFAKVADAKLKKLLTGGDLNDMRELFGQEEGMQENTDENATEYFYDARGFRFVKYRIRGRVINALRFLEVRKARTT